MPSLWCSICTECASAIPHGGFRNSYASPRCRISRYCRTLIPLSVSLCHDLSHPVFDDVGLTGFKSRANSFHWPKLLTPFSSLLFSLSVLSYIGWYCWVAVFGLVGCKLHYPRIALSTFFDNNNNDNNNNNNKYYLFIYFYSIIFIDMTTPPWWREKVMVLRIHIVYL